MGMEDFKQMIARVIYDSYFGNTEAVAKAIGEQLASQCETEVLRIAEMSPERLAPAQLLVVGSPTRGFRPSDATKLYLKNLKVGELKGTQVAAFDTRIAVQDVDNAIFTVMEKIFGYAAKPIAKDLCKAGGILLLPAEGFFVQGTNGPLKPGEIERAAAWGRQLLEKSLASSTTP